MKSAAAASPSTASTSEISSAATCAASSVWCCRTPGSSTAPIRDNIACGREGAADREIVRAAKAAHADHFIRTLPEGYNTVLNEEASNLSQGQRQLLTIARALLADPAVLILDEATSSVDTRSEIHIQRAMAELMKGRTSFV